MTIQSKNFKVVFHCGKPLTKVVLIAMITVCTITMVALRINIGKEKARLEAAKAAGSRTIMIATDGVFSMDGYIANLEAICDLADEYDALVMVDDSHAVGFVGATGRGTAEYCGVQGRVDIITGTLGKALGGASGGYTSGRKGYHRIYADPKQRPEGKKGNADKRSSHTCKERRQPGLGFSGRFIIFKQAVFTRGKKRKNDIDHHYQPYQGR